MEMQDTTYALPKEFGEIDFVAFHLDPSRADIIKLVCDGLFFVEMDNSSKASDRCINTLQSYFKEKAYTTNDLFRYFQTKDFKTICTIMHHTVFCANEKTILFGRNPVGAVVKEIGRVRKEEERKFRQSLLQGNLQVCFREKSEDLESDELETNTAPELGTNIDAPVHTDMDTIHSDMDTTTDTEDENIDKKINYEEVIDQKNNVISQLKQQLKRKTEAPVPAAKRRKIDVVDQLQEKVLTEDFKAQLRYLGCKLAIALLEKLGSLEFAIVIQRFKDFESKLQLPDENMKSQLHLIVDQILLDMEVTKQPTPEFLTGGPYFNTGFEGWVLEKWAPYWK